MLVVPSGNTLPVVASGDGEARKSGTSVPNDPALDGTDMVAIDDDGDGDGGGRGRV